MELNLTRLSVLGGALAILAGCATQQAPAPSGPPGKHLVYRDSGGNVVRQFDYPDDGFCRRVEAIAGRSARCQAEPAAGFTATATLRYNPPGVLVRGHYADMNRCRADTATMSPGVQLVEPCTAR
jgi:hypothetical protein